MFKSWLDAYYPASKYYLDVTREGGVTTYVKNCQSAARADDLVPVGLEAV